MVPAFQEARDLGENRPRGKKMIKSRQLMKTIESPISIQIKHTLCESHVKEGAAVRIKQHLFNQERS